MELVHYFGGWLEGPSKQTDRTDGGWVQSTFGARYLWCQGRANKTGGTDQKKFLKKFPTPPLLQDLCATGKK